MVAEMRRRPITVDEFEQLIETGFFGPEERVELVNGEMIQMPPIGDGHASHTKRSARIVSRLAGHRAILSVQDPIRLSRFARPQPDVALLRPSVDDYLSATATAKDVMLLIEVADSTLSFDRVIKGQLYAAAGIADYWIIDLVHRQLLVLREPTAEGYASVQTLAAGDSVAPLAFPDVTIAVSELLIEA